MTVATAFNLSTNTELNFAREFYAGVECEIESVKNKEEDFEGFVATEDGSLRNYGVEFISIPLPKDELLSCFTNLHAEIEFYNSSEAFSPRTSTHVHINCRSLETEQVKNLILLYALYEDFFFAMCEQGRRDNIHCVPLSETFLPNVYAKPLEVLIEKWHKYTALNIIPLTMLGTVEFRHLQGTGDPELFKEWLTALDNLWTLCQTDKVTPETLTDERALKGWWKCLFGHSSRIMMLEPSFNNVIANNLLDVKFAFI